jgi:hypothetical protein
MDFINAFVASILARSTVIHSIDRIDIGDSWLVSKSGGRQPRRVPNRIGNESSVDKSIVSGTNGVA